MGELVMRGSLTEIDKKAFWEVVNECLLKFHKLNANEAGERIEKLRKTIKEPPGGADEDLFYHAEPFDVACDLAGKPLTLTKARRKEYDCILECRNW
jgi:hypothetical protein